MSRTDVHVPYWVKERDPSWRNHFVESHNHAQYISEHRKEPDPDRPGYDKWVPVWKTVDHCDLDESLSVRGWTRTACSMQVVNTGQNIFCGCNLCTGFVGRRQDRRASRAYARRQLREIIKTLPEDYEDVDVAPYRGSNW